MAERIRMAKAGRGVLSEAILKTLGYDAAAIARLRTEKIVA